MRRLTSGQRRYWLLPLLLSCALLLGAVSMSNPAAQAADDEDDGLLSGLLDLPSTSDTSSATPSPSTTPSSGTESPPTTSSPSDQAESTTPPPSSSKPPALFPPALKPPALLPPDAETPQPRLPPTKGTSSDVKPGPGRMWTLTGSTLKLGGSRYHGYSEQPVAGGTVKTLHFTAERLEITDLVQRGELGNGTTVRASGAPGSVSTIVNGPIHLYTRELTGKIALAGQPLVPITLAPDTLALPNLDLSILQLPELTFKDAVVRNVDLRGGDLKIPGASIELE